MSCDVPTVTRSRISIEDSMLLFEGMLRLLAACVAFASLIYCYDYANAHWSNFIQGPFVFAVSSLTNLPAGFYQLVKGVACLLEAIFDIAAAKRHEAYNTKPRDDVARCENAPFLPDDQTWLNTYRTHPGVGTILAALYKQKTWQKMPYPAELDTMLVTALHFNRLYNGTALLSKKTAKKLYSSGRWLVHLLLLSALANVALFFIGTGTAGWKWIPIVVLTFSSLFLLRWVAIQIQAVRERSKRFQCYDTEDPWKTQSILRKRLVLLLCEPLDGPYAFLSKARESGDDAARLSSIFRISPIITGVFVLLPIASWLSIFVPILTSQWQQYLPLLGATLSLIAAVFFFFTQKMALYSKVNIPQYPANIWVFRYFADVVRRLYG